MNGILSKLKFLNKNSELAVAVGLFLVLGVMIVPVPPMVLDLFLAMTLAISVVILLVSVYSKRPLDFSTFPTVLLITTLFRLALNIASTRNILLHGGTDGTEAAGEIIQSFGEFVVEGNYVVGIIIFIILVIINFMVITKGAGRVAEVAARFTLDAMPGKQMAIDADLNAGIINDQEAKRRRREIAEEADFYGSMDGASKFVRGDAIAGIMITALNIIAGMIIGVAQSGMSMTDAAQTFTLLTVGDGLITQIPAIIISTAAGIIVTRNATEHSLGDALTKQLQLHPRAIYMAASASFVFAFIGLPTVPFMAISGVLATIAYKIDKQNEKIAQDKAAEVPEDKKARPENLEDLLSLELVELEVGYGLVSLVDSEQNGDLLERITHIRKQFALDWGIIIPSVRIKDNLELKPGGYVVKIKGIMVAKGELLVDHFLAMDPGSVIEKISGVETVEPVFGLPAVWIVADQRDDAQYYGYTVVDLSTVVATHLTEVLKNNLHELFGRQELVRVLDNFKQEYPKIVSDLVPEILPLGIVLKSLQNLLREGVSIRDLRTILETLSEYGVKTKDTDSLTEHVRQALYRTITAGVKSGEGDIPLFTLDRTIEESIASNLIQTDHGQQLSLDPKVTQTILASLNEKIEEATNLGEKMVVLCSPVIRSHFKKLTEKFIPNLTVVSHNELSPDVNIRSLGTVRL
ncbi:MAG: flagellar biosynthesis protein FlhA [Bdellovibrionales bacterium RIFOXYD12_FULL_39_22]|nr:MAG: flagellar biosynthesis protein FlhA [Bdellovibrionales bacterium RIFOXYB1_FULL_39_21]OFZ42834.1 MAG: flagellar biosynthesis protein FlhA [Bdellovibrionales bacterium RIFOXYC12_FULL_39_17]OFZ47506.1 MAG: flagellar biosynthesis protein FlhA [Bdellovibrionales bacterium RIFOXYC1_FULL_39_130]OFZ75594.1 MAG: flagellar biosynthesis protein FlhA [Bdellovibrionales bacterium RIFOXYD1_FULL_39_84]OFZ93917.1 MAG: flagellar biosynthesis protein FlhA [Bdellovibrionales bacterium RIFOXYD12_FULL_39_22